MDAWNHSCGSSGIWSIVHVELYPDLIRERAAAAEPTVLKDWESQLVADLSTHFRCRRHLQRYSRSSTSFLPGPNCRLVVAFRTEFILVYAPDFAPRYKLDPTTGEGLELQDTLTL